MLDNVFQRIPQKLHAELIDVVVKNQHITIERIVSQGQCSAVSDWYDQNQHEWVIVLQGEAVITYAGSQADVYLKAGDYLQIPAHQKHQVRWTHPDIQTVWLAVFYDV